MGNTEHMLSDRELSVRSDEQGLSLVHKDMVVRGDFAALYHRLRKSNLRNEMLVRASGILQKKRSDPTGSAQTDPMPLAIDATAGLGEDSFLLAAAGFRVLLYERDPVIAMLLKDALERGQKDPQIADIISRMQLRGEDSIQGLSALEEKPAVIYLDPMFPERQKSALVKKKFQLLHVLQQPCTDETELMEAAVKAGPQRIIVKRPLKGPYLADRKPSFSLKGKSIRYDCYVFPDN